MRKKRINYLDALGESFVEKVPALETAVPHLPQMPTMPRMPAIPRVPSTHSSAIGHGHYVTEEYAAAMAKAGLPNAGESELWQLQIHHVTPDYVSRLMALNIPNMSVNGNCAACHPPCTA